MRVTVTGVMRIHGVSVKSNSAYDMSRLYCLQPIEPRKSEKNTVEGSGFQQAEIALSPAALPAFLGLQFPCVVELQTEMEMQRGQMVPIVVGLKKAA